MTTETQTAPASGSVYRLVVRSADEAVQTIRARFGSSAKVLSVKQLEGQGIVGLFSRPKLEVVVQIGGAESEPASYIGNSGAEAAAGDMNGLPSGVARIQEPGLPASAAPAPADAVPAAQLPLTPDRRWARTEGLVGVDLADLLRRSGFSETFLARLSSLPSWLRHQDRPLHVTLVELGNELRKMASGRRLVPLPAKTAFIGSMGVGRTTALCKWLGMETFARGRGGRVIKVEFDRPNPAENLAVYCEALGLSMEHYSHETNLEVGQGEFLYADLPGIEIRRPGANRQLSEFLDTAKFEGRVLVLNALYDHSTLRAAYDAGRELGATHLVFTHCDELIHWGKLMDFLIDGELSPLFLATGPSLSGDCDENCFGAVLHKTIPGA